MPLRGPVRDHQFHEPAAASPPKNVIQSLWALQDRRVCPRRRMFKIAVIVNMVDRCEAAILSSAGKRDHTPRLPACAGPDQYAGYS